MADPRPKRRLSRWVNGNMAELLLAVVVLMLGMVAYLDGKEERLAERVSVVEGDCKATSAVVLRIEKSTDLILATLLDERGDPNE